MKYEFKFIKKKTDLKLDTRFMIVENQKIYVKSQKSFNGDFFSSYNSVNLVLTLWFSKGNWIKIDIINVFQNEKF